MPEIRTTIEDEALDFVLKGKQTAPDATPGTGEDLTATIRGDLEHVNLADIFQTLTMSQMEGTLRIKGGFDASYVHFKDGKIRVLPPQEVSLRRLGHRLINSGLLEANELRAGLMKQKREGGDLGDILAASEKIEKVQYDAIRVALEEDFLLELFTLQRGAFSFFKEAFPIAGLEDRFEACVEFPSDQVLLEIARRSDEWNIIIESIGELDELFTRAGAVDASELGEIAQDLYAQIDGKRTLRDIAGGMLDSLFEVAKAAQQLADSGAIKTAPVDHLIALARSSITANDTRNAYQFLSLVSSAREPSNAERVEIAELLAQAGDTKQAAEILALTAEELEDAEVRFDLLQRAREYDGLNRMVLEGLLECLRVDGIDSQSDAFYTTGLQLTEIYSDEEEYALALALIEQLEVERLGDLSLAMRKAKVLSKMGRRDDALEALERIATVYRVKKDLSGLTKTLEQILKLDARNAKARAELKSLRESKGVKRAKRLALLLGAIIILKFGWTYLSDSWAETDARKKLDQATALVDTGLNKNLIEAQRIAETVAAQLPNSQVSDEARDVIRRVRIRRQAIARAENTKVTNALLAGIDDAVAMLGRKQYVGALRHYKSLLAKHGRAITYRDQINKSLAARFTSLLAEMKTDIDKIETTTHAAPDETKSPKARKALLAQLEQVFPPDQIRALDTLDAAMQEDLRLRLSALPNGFQATLSHYLDLGKHTEDERQELRSLIEIDRNKTVLDGTFVEAEAAERRLDYAEAYRLYSKLVENYRGSNSTLRAFREKRDYYGGIRRELRLLSEATERGDYREAARRYRALEDLGTRIPFEEIVELPFRIVSNPPGARIRNGNRDLGRTPMLLRYKPKQVLNLRIELDGFVPVDIPDDARPVGSFETVFEMRPVFEKTVGGSLTRRSAFDRDNGMLITSDRSGTLWGFDVKNRRVAYQKKFNDLSGDLGVPLVVGGRVLLPARDGRLRCLETQTGREVWTTQLGHQLVGELVRSGRGVWVAGEQGVLSFVAISTGKVQQTTKPAGRLRTAPARDAMDRLFVVDRDGTVVALDSDGQELWRRTIRHAGWTQPVVADTHVLIASQDRHLYALRTRDGKNAWKLDVGQVMRYPPLIEGDRAFVAPDLRELLEIDTHQGTVIRSIRLPDRPSGPPTVHDYILFLPIRRQGVIAFRLQDLSQFCTIARELSTELPVQSAGRGHLVFQSARGRLRFYDRALLRQR